MPITNGVVVKPISTTDVGTAIGSSSRNVGYLCSNEHGLINPWSVYKPVRFDKVTELTEDERKSVNYGMAAIPYNTMIDAYRGAIEISLRYGNTWEYVPPIENFRLGDFNGYDGKGENPFSASFDDYGYSVRVFGFVDYWNDILKQMGLNSYHYALACVPADGSLVRYTYISPNTIDTYVSGQMIGLDTVISADDVGLGHRTWVIMLVPAKIPSDVSNPLQYDFVENTGKPVYTFPTDIGILSATLKEVDDYLDISIEVVEITDTLSTFRYIFTNADKDSDRVFNMRYYSNSHKYSFNWANLPSMEGYFSTEKLPTSLSLKAGESRSVEISYDFNFPTPKPQSGYIQLSFYSKDAYAGQEHLKYASAIFLREDPLPDVPVTIYGQEVGPRITDGQRMYITFENQLITSRYLITFKEMKVRITYKSSGGVAVLPQTVDADKFSMDYNYLSYINQALIQEKTNTVGSLSFPDPIGSPHDITSTEITFVYTTNLPDFPGEYTTTHTYTWP